MVSGFEKAWAEHQRREARREQRRLAGWGLAFLAVWCAMWALATGGC